MKQNQLSFPGLGIEEFTIDAIAFQIGSVRVAWYSIIITLGIILAILYVWFRFKEAGLKSDDLLDFVLFVVPFGIVGARLYYVVFEFDRFYVEGDFGETLLKIVQVWNGGLAIYGGIIAGGIAAVLVARHKKIKLLKILDMLAPAVMMAQAIGRWGNFMNVEAFGGPTTLPWRMCSPRIAKNFFNNDLVTSDEYFKVLTGELGAHPTFFYESLWNIIGFVVIYFLFVRNKKLHKIDGQLFYSYLIWYGLGRAWIEGLRTDSLYLIDGVLRVSQLVALLSFITGVGLMIFGLIRYYKYGKGKMVVVIPRDKNGKIIKEEAIYPVKNEAKEEVKSNGTNNQRKRSGSKGKRKNKKRRR
ncbi:MAG: prolipoprotein diacylglyceryl transferase [Clostridia bacterium]|nr:prolipoprotein diacylglyceryl transferase [Clostridia bacterium]